jgi:hypothetical protein
MHTSTHHLQGLQMNDCSPSVKRLLAKLGHARNVKLLLAPKTTQDRATNVVELIGSSKAISQGNAMQLPRQLLKQRDYALNTNIRAKLKVKVCRDGNVAPRLPDLSLNRTNYSKSAPEKTLGSFHSLLTALCTESIGDIALKTFKWCISRAFTLGKRIRVLATSGKRTARSGS